MLLIVSILQFIALLPQLCYNFLSLRCTHVTITSMVMSCIGIILVFNCCFLVVVPLRPAIYGWLVGCRQWINMKCIPWSNGDIFKHFHYPAINSPANNWDSRVSCKLLAMRMRHKFKSYSSAYTLDGVSNATGILWGGGEEEAKCKSELTPSALLNAADLWEIHLQLVTALWCCHTQYNHLHVLGRGLRGDSWLVGLKRRPVSIFSIILDTFLRPVVVRFLKNATLRPVWIFHSRR